MAGGLSVAPSVRRAHLMHAVLSRLAPPPPPPDGGAPYQTVDALLKEVIVDKVLARGHMDIASAHKFHRLMALAGPQCLSEHLVKVRVAGPVFVRILTAPDPIFFDPVS